MVKKDPKEAVEREARRKKAVEQVDKSLGKPKVKCYSLEEWQAMIEADRERYYPHDWHEGSREE